MVFEAHSTDYQTVAALTALVEDHWAVLKVGPGLTFALREALFALAAIETGTGAGRRLRSNLLEVVERGCWPSPATGRATTPGDAAPSSASPAATATATGCATTGPTPRSRRGPGTTARQPRPRSDIPLPLLSQYPAGPVRPRPAQANSRRSRATLVIDRVRDVLRGYGRAGARRRPQSRSTC